MAEIEVIKRIEQSGGFTEADISEMAHIGADWVFIKTLVQKYGTKVNNTDLKAYLITASALMFANRRLMRELRKEIGSAFT